MLPLTGGAVGAIKDQARRESYSWLATRLAMNGIFKLADKAINPYAITLDPGRWEADGLFEGQTMTVDEALSKTEGIESLWLDRLPVTA